MSEMIDWIVAAAEEEKQNSFTTKDAKGHEGSQNSKPFTTEGTGLHRESQNLEPFTTGGTEVHRGNGGSVSECAGGDGLESYATDSAALDRAACWEEERERRIYRGRTIKMLRRYMRYSIETGRLPSLLGREFFRAKVTAYIVVTFEDRVIFVHDMETCLNKLDEFSRQLIARHVLQEHSLEDTARLLECGKRTVQRLLPIALDVLSEILLDVGLLERISPKREKSCQEGESDQIFASRCETSENKF